MKTFTAKQLSKQPAAVFREVDLNGSAKINHDRYPDKVFIIEGRERHQYVEGKTLTFDTIQELNVKVNSNLSTSAILGDKE